LGPLPIPPPPHQNPHVFFFTGFASTLQKNFGESFKDVFFWGPLPTTPPPNNNLHVFDLIRLSKVHFVIIQILALFNLQTTPMHTVTYLIVANNGRWISVCLALGLKFCLLSGPSAILRQPHCLDHVYVGFNLWTDK